MGKQAATELVVQQQVDAVTGIYVGDVHMRDSRADGGLEVSAAGDREALPAGLGSLDEEEPWWRLLGQPITAAWPGGVEEGVGASGLGKLMVVKLRFREENENPRVVRLEATGSAIRVSLDEV